MKKVLKIILLVVVLLILVVFGGSFLYLKLAFPKVGPATDLKIELTPDRIQRGEYLANHVAVCMDCHSERDWSLFSAPPKPGTEGAGGEVFDQELGFPGIYYARNITPAGIGDWTDGEIFRAMTSGVDKDDKPMFPIMPYRAISKLPIEDIYSIIAYLRVLEPIEKSFPESESDFPMNLIINMIPKDPEFGPTPTPDNPVAYGEMLSMACFDCHTPQEKGRPITALAYSGGFEFKLPGGGIVRSVNITPDKETGIGNWTEDQFIQRFKQYTDSSFHASQLGEKQFNTYMPWVMFSGMTESDLSALYVFLHSLDPISNKVEKYTEVATESNPGM